MQVIILAGGLGTRLRAEVPDLPKPMAPIKGKPFLEHQMDYWISEGATCFILSVGYRSELITEHFGDSYRGIKVKYAHEKTPLGTGGGLVMAAQLLEEAENFIALNGDSFFDVKMQRLIDFHKKNGSDWTFSLFSTTDAKRYMGMELNSYGRVLSLASTKSAGERLANAGVYLINLMSFRKHGFKPETRFSLEEELVPEIIKNSKVYGLEFKTRFIDIGIPEDYKKACEDNRD